MIAEHSTHRSYHMPSRSLLRVTYRLSLVEWSENEIFPGNEIFSNHHTSGRVLIHHKMHGDVTAKLQSYILLLNGGNIFTFRGFILSSQVEDWDV